MRILIILLSATLVACVSGTPDTGGDDEVTANGGRLAMPGCGFDLTTIVGAEAPVLGGDVTGADPTPHQVHLGFGGDPRTTMAIVWRTDEATTVTEVEFGTGGAMDQAATGATYRYIAGIGGIGDLIRVHEAHLCGLTADTEYTYRVGGGGTWTEPRTFRTAPDITATPDATVRIAMIGDSRGGYDVWNTLATDMIDRAPDLIMFSGDAVTVGQVQEEWDSFFAVAPELLATVPMVSAHGNHDLNSVNYYSLFAMPGDESNYAFDYGHAHMTVLNDSPTDSGDLSGAIKTFLDQDLGGTDAIWKIINHHRPLWSSGTRHGSDASLRELWGPVIDEHHADLVVAGHDHIYERTRVMKGDQVQAATADGTVYLVTGGAGASLYNVEPDFYTEVADSRHSMVVVDVRADLLTVQAFEPDGLVPFDELTIVRP